MGLDLIPYDPGICFTTRSTSGEDGLIDSFSRLPEQAAVELGRTLQQILESIAQDLE